MTTSSLRLTINPGVTGIDVSNLTYKLAHIIFEEEGEFSGKRFVGSGHSAAQKIAEKAEEEWLSRGGKAQRPPSPPPLPNALSTPLHKSQLVLDFPLEEVNANEVEHSFYRLCVKLFEAYGEGDPESGFRGNGHHAAQSISTLARQEWLRRTLGAE